jgi:hypothetical protein
MAIKIRSTPSFGWEVKPEVSCRNVLRHVKVPWGISDTDMQNSHSFVHSSYFTQMSLLVGLPEISGGRVRSYPQPVSSPPWLFVVTCQTGYEKLGRRWAQFWDIVSPHHNQLINRSIKAHFRSNPRPRSNGLYFLASSEGSSTRKVCCLPPPPHPFPEHGIKIQLSNRCNLCNSDDKKDQENNFAHHKRIAR